MLRLKNKILSKWLLWFNSHSLSQYLLAIIGWGLCANALLLVFGITFSESKLYYHLSNGFQAHPFLWFILLLPFTIVVVWHLASIAWIRTPRSFNSAPQIAIYTLIVLSIVIAIIHIFTVRYYKQEVVVGETQWFLTSQNIYDLTILQDNPSRETIGVYTLPFHKLKEGETIEDDRWPFSIHIRKILHYARAGGEASKVYDSKQRRIVGYPLKGILNASENWRMYTSKPGHTAGKGLVWSINNEKREHASYAANTNTPWVHNVQPIPGQDEYSIRMLPYRAYPKFSWLVTREGHFQFLEIWNSDHSQMIDKQPLNLDQPAKWRGFHFKIAPPDSNQKTIQKNRLQIEIVSSSLQSLLKPIVLLLWLIACATTCIRFGGYIRNHSTRRIVF